MEKVTQGIYLAPGSATRITIVLDWEGPPHPCPILHKQTGRQQGAAETYQMDFEESDMVVPLSCAGFLATHQTKIDAGQDYAG